LGLLLAWALLWAAFAGLTALGQAQAPRQMAEAYRQMQTSAWADTARSLQAYAHGPYRTLFQVRATELKANYLASFLLLSPHFLAMFLLGLWAWRHRVFTNPAEHQHLIGRVALWGLVLGLPGNYLYARWSGQGWAGPTMAWEGLGYAVYMLAAPALSLAYLGLLLQAARRPGIGRWLRALRWPGRMALSNYLLQSLVLTTVFYAYGLGCYGRLRLHWGLVLSATLWLAQLPLSRWWLTRFRFGPAEWLWRTLTYGEVQKMRY
jgi:uncharacterized protein